MRQLSTNHFEHAVAQFTSSLKSVGICLDSDESFDLDTILTDFLEEKCDVSIESDLAPQPPQILINDAIQFPRLITAINAHFRLNGEELNDMIESMNITLSELDHLFNHAEERCKAFDAHPFELFNSNDKAFTFIENTPLSKPFTGKFNNDGTGLAITVDGYYGNGEDGDHTGMIAYLGDIGGELQLAVYAGANIDYPSHLISLESAKNKTEVINHQA